MHNEEQVKAENVDPKRSIAFVSAEPLTEEQLEAISGGGHMTSVSCTAGDGSSGPSGSCTATYDFGK